jgi:hypothetical protein
MTSTYSGSLGGAVTSDYIPFNNLTTYMGQETPIWWARLSDTKRQPGNLIDPWR